MVRQALTVAKATKIAQDLWNDKDLVRHVSFIRDRPVTAKTLRESDIETALARHAWVEYKELRYTIQDTLMGWFRIHRKATESHEKRKATFEARRIEKAAHLQAQKAAFLEDYSDVDTALPTQPITPKSVQPPTPEPQGIFKEEEASPAVMGVVSVETAPEPVEPSSPEEESVVAIIARKLKELPSKPSEVDATRILSEVTAPLLVEAEQFLSRKMKRVDHIWWKLLERDLGVIRRDVSFSDVRTLYAEEKEKRRRRAKAAFSKSGSGLALAAPSASCTQWPSPPPSPKSTEGLPFVSYVEDYTTF